MKKENTPTQFLILLLSASVLPYKLIAQPASPHLDKGWFTIAVGPDSFLFSNGTVSANFGRHKFWQVAFHSAGDFALSKNAVVTEISTIGVGYGFSKIKRIGRVAISAGPGFAFGNDKPKGLLGEREHFKTVAFVANAQMTFTPIKEMGIGIDILGNLNSRISTLGFRISLVIEGNK